MHLFLVHAFSKFYLHLDTGLYMHSQIKFRSLHCIGDFMDIIAFISKYFYCKKTEVVIFADISKIVNIFIKTVIKTPEKLKELEFMYQYPIYICIS